MNTTITVNTTAQDDATTPGENLVVLHGTASTTPAQSLRHGGKTAIGLNLTIPRPTPAPREPNIDSIHVTALTPDMQDTLAGVVPGDTVRVTGRLARNLFRRNGETRSAYEVIVATATITNKAPR